MARWALLAGEASGASSYEGAKQLWISTAMQASLRPLSRTTEEQRPAKTSNH
jgi:hypothetical protein